MPPQLPLLLLAVAWDVLATTELRWQRVSPGVPTIGCENGTSGERRYWLQNGHPVNPTPDRFWTPGNYICVTERTDDVRLERALMVTESADQSCWSGEAGRRPRVADGVRAREAPWVAQLLVAGRFTCGCSVISQRWALTAAHCLPADTKPLSVALGPLRAAAGPRLAVTTTLPHPRYRRGARVHDLALLELSPHDDQLAVVCLPPGPEFLGRFSQGLLLGWGQVGPQGGHALRLQEALLPLVDHARCEEALPGIVGSQVFCAGFGEAYRADACSGDSGGPLAVLLGENPVLVGVVSWGRACARPHTFGVYTRVDAYLAWIRMHVRDLPVTCCDMRTKVEKDAIGLNSSLLEQTEQRTGTSASGKIPIED